jgi:uncharacterized membrane protein
MPKLARTILLYVPVSRAYSKWEDLESFPAFMPEVRFVHRLDDTHYRWCVVLWGKEEEWVAKITRRIPDRRIEWRYVSGAPNAGAVTFLSLSPAKTLLTLQLGYEPRKVIERIGDVLGVVGRHVDADLRGFKTYVER